MNIFPGLPIWEEPPQVISSYMWTSLGCYVPCFPWVCLKLYPVFAVSHVEETNFLHPWILGHLNRGENHVLMSHWPLLNGENGPFNGDTANIAVRVSFFRALPWETPRPQEAQFLKSTAPSCRKFNTQLPAKKKYTNWNQLSYLENLFNLTARISSLRPSTDFHLRKENTWELQFASDAFILEACCTNIEAVGLPSFGS